MPRLIGVRRKATLIGTLAILLIAAGAGESPVYERVVSSVQGFQRNFGELKKAGSMNSIERIVFSLILTHTKTPESAPSSPVAGRT